MFLALSGICSSFPIYRFCIKLFFIVDRPKLLFQNEGNQHVPICEFKQAIG
jgi:hypothetical protein